MATQATQAAKAIKFAFDHRTYYNMLYEMIDDFIALHGTARFLAQFCRRYQTAECTVKDALAGIVDVERLFHEAFKVGPKKADAAALANAAMHLGMPYDYMLYLNVLTTKLNTQIQHMQSYILYVLLLQASGAQDPLAKVRAANAACAPAAADQLHKMRPRLEPGDYHVMDPYKGLASLLPVFAKKARRSSHHILS